MIHRKDIDGLRAIAVVPVVLYHAGYSSFSGGFVGVDVFFVISGYLITGIIYKEIQVGRFSIVHFYERRARRILPALFAVILACLIAAWIVQPPKNLEAFSSSALSALFFSSNLYFWKSAGYFATDSEFRLLLHTWSLSVEEQFYLVWPVFLLVFSKYFSRHLEWLIVTILIGSFLLSIVALEYRPNAAFYLIPTRAWELMTGAALVLLNREYQPTARISNFLSGIGIALIAIPIFYYTKQTPFPGLAALPVCLGTALVLQFGEHTYVGRALSISPLVFLGLISYSLYLWHWPILAISRTLNGSLDLDQSARFIAILVAFLISILSWKLVESPFRSNHNFSRTKVFRLSGIGQIALCCACLIVIISNGLPASVGSDASLYLKLASRGPIQDKCFEASPQQGMCRLGTDGIEPTVVLWGDSHASAIAPAINDWLVEENLAGVGASFPACAPLTGVHRKRYNWQKCVAFNQSVLDYLKEHSAKIETVIVNARWALNDTGQRYKGEAGNPVQLVDANNSIVSDNRKLFAAGLRNTLSEIRGMGIHVIILGDVPEIGWDVPMSAFGRERIGLDGRLPPSPHDVTLRQGPTEIILDTIANEYGADFISIWSLMCETNCAVSYDGMPLYTDDDHISEVAASKIIAPRLKRFLRLSG